MYLCTEFKQQTINAGGQPHNKTATNTMITLKDVQIDALNLYYTEELITLKAEAVSLAEKMHAAGDYTAAAEYSTMVGKINDELTARGDTPAAVVYEVAIKEYGYYVSCGTFDTLEAAMMYAKKNAHAKSFSIGTMSAQDVDTDGAIVKIIYSRTRKGNKYIIMDRRAA